MPGSAAEFKLTQLFAFDLQRHLHLRQWLMRLLISFALLATAPCVAENSADAAQRLATDLTPVGAIRNGNDENTIPPWKGGLSQLPAGYQPGDLHVDPFAGDAPLFRIDSSSIDQFEDKLTPGQIAMLQRYSESYYLPVYPGRRSAAFPQRKIGRAHV